MLVIVSIAIALSALAGFAPLAASTLSATGVRTKPINVRRLDVPKTAKATARALTRVETQLRGSNRDRGHLASLGRAQQLAYRALAAHPKWVPKVIATVPKRIRGAVRANVFADRALRRVGGVAPPGFPDWAIRRPERAAKLRAYYEEGERTYGVSWAYLAAIHLIETRMGRIHGLSSAGAQGPMQFIPSTWAAYGTGDINDNHDAILAAARYLDANGAASDIDHALFRYNNSDSYVAAIKAYAAVLVADPRAYDGYYSWQVFYATTEGTYLLPEGWRRK
jgi:membrane-bound lytic murein transglycosylase B